MASSRGAVRFLLSACIFWTETRSWFIKLPTCLVNGVSDLYKLHCNNTDTVRLHCLLDDNNLAGITCTPWKWIYDGYCPYYNHDQQRIDQRRCPGNSSVCPSNVQGGQYPSYLVYKYMACLWLQNSSQVSNVTSDKYGDAVPIDHTGNDAETITALAVVVVMLSIVVLITTLTLIRIIHRSKREQPPSQLKNSYHVDICENEKLEETA